MGKIIQTAGRNALGEFAPEFAHFKMCIRDRYSPDASKNPQMKLVGGLTLRKLASFPQSAFLKPHLEELEKELQAIE